MNRKKAFYNVFLTMGHSNLFIVLFGNEFHLANASKEDGYLYYNPASLPYNPTAPLRNSIPYIPLEIDEKGVRISNVIPPEYINRHIRDYVEEVNRNYTENDLQEICFIQENLKLSTISKNLMMLGSVLEDDAISLSSEDETHWKKGNFKKDPSQYVPVPANALRMHVDLVEKMENAEKISNKSEFNREITFTENKKYGLIASGSAFNYAKDVVDVKGLDINILKLGFSNPTPSRLIADFLEGLDEVFVVEEVDPIMEKEVLAIVAQNKLDVVVHGKLDGTFPKYHEYTPDVVLDGLNKVLDCCAKEEYELSSSLQELVDAIPNRAPVLCSGCPHRSMYYGVNKAMEELNIPASDVVFASDIGCYTLGINPPYYAADYLLSMGSSVGDGCGFSIATNQKVVSFIGDSTFFHSGVSPLINAIHNKANFVLTVLDNRITAMTGGQPNPGIPIDAMGDKAPEISIRKLALACGCSFVRVINPLNLEQVINTYKEALEYDGVAVIISKSPCTLIKGYAKKPPVEYVESNCNNCLKCTNELACPAISLNNGKIILDQSMCVGCNVCVQVCKYGALNAGMR